jgi:hypothetical protein
MMTVSSPRVSAAPRARVNMEKAKTANQQPFFTGHEEQAEYREGLRDLDSNTLKRLHQIQRHPQGLGHELAIEYGKDNTKIDWLNEEKKVLLRTELLNKKIDPKLSSRARELYHDLDKAIDRTLKEELVPNYPHNKRHKGPSSNSSAGDNLSITG